jgi:hypothetical protein
MRSAKLSQALRERIVAIVKEVLAINKVHLGESLTFNRLSGALFHMLLSEENRGLSEDEAVNLAIHVTTKENLPLLLAEADKVLQIKEEHAKRQVHGLVNNLIAENLPNREQILTDTLNMLKKFPLVRSITAIRTLVRARVANQHVDVDEDEFMYLQ